MRAAEPKRLQLLTNAAPQAAAPVRTVRHPPVPRGYLDPLGGAQPARLRRRGQASASNLAEIAKLIDDGKLKTVVETVLPLTDARRAHELIETGHTRGKIVLKVI